MTCFDKSAFTLFFGRLASKKAYVLLFGLVGCLFGAMFAYYNATISTLEKRFRIPSRNSGLIMVGNDIGSLVLSSGVGYYCGSGHRPRWVAFGVLTFAVFCFMNAAPHFMYGAGEDALRLTTEIDGRQLEGANATILATASDESLCHRSSDGDHLEQKCHGESGSLTPQVILFVSQLISGIGQTLYNSLGTTYMDDNVQKNKLPSLISKKSLARCRFVYWKLLKFKASRTSFGCWGVPLDTCWRPNSFRSISNRV